MPTMNRLVRQFFTHGWVSSHAGVHIPGRTHEDRDIDGDSGHPRRVGPIAYFRWGRRQGR